MNKYIMRRKIKFSVQVVIVNEHGQILAVSRKDNHNDFGLPGGKVDLEDKSLKYALIREVKEETGLNIKEEDLSQIFSMFKDGFMGYTYLCEIYDGKIETDEPHVVKWTTFKDVIEGSFGKWNQMVYESISNMGIKVKL